MEITLDPLITGPNTIVIEYDGNNLPREIDVTIAYKGTVDGANIGTYMSCKKRYILFRVVLDTVSDVLY